MEQKSGNGWKVFGILCAIIIALGAGVYLYKKQNPDYDPWEEPWEKSSSPVDLGFDDEQIDDDEADDDDDHDEASEENDDADNDGSHEVEGERE